MANDGELGIVSKGPEGATISTAYVGRNVRVFAVIESELHTLSVFNTIATTFFSVGSGLGSIAVGIWITAMFTEKPTPAGVVLTELGIPLLCALAFVSFMLAGWATLRKRSTLKAIREQSTASGG